MNLWDIERQYLEIMDIEGDDPDTQAARQAAMDEIVEAFDTKAENIIRFSRNLDASAEAIKIEEKHLADKRRALENKSAWLKKYLGDTMNRLGMDTVKAGIFEAKFRVNREAVNIIDLASIPATYYIPQEPKLSLTAIKDALQAGQSVPGAELSRGKSLLIR